MLCHQFAWIFTWICITRNIPTTPNCCMHNFPHLPISKQIIPVKYFVISNCPQFCILPCDFSCYFSYVILVVPSLLFFSCYFVTVNHIQNTVYANPQPWPHARQIFPSLFPLISFTSHHPGAAVYFKLQF